MENIPGFLDENDRSAPRSDGLSFEEWRGRFFDDARTQGVFHIVEAMGNTSLCLIWKEGWEPTVQAMLERGSDGFL